METVFFMLVIGLGVGTNAGTLQIVPDFKTVQTCERAAVTAKRAIIHVAPDARFVEVALKHECAPYTK